MTTASERATGRSLGRGLIMAAAVVLILAAISLGSYVVTLVALSVLISLLLDPLRARLVARGWRTSWALLACLAVYVVTLAVTGVLVAYGLADFVRNLDDYTQALDASLASLGSPELARVIVDALAGLADLLIGSLGSGIAIIGYSVIVVAYFLLEADKGAERILWATGGSPEALERAGALADKLRSFIVARAVLGLAAAVLDTIVLVILGVPSALLWGVLSFIFSFVPNVGFILALIPPTLLALAISGVWTAIAVVIAYSVINVLIDYILQPRYIGGSVNLSALVVTLSIVFWGIVLGPAGALLAIPLTIVAVAIADAFDDSRPAARMLVQDVPLSD